MRNKQRRQAAVTWIIAVALAISWPVGWVSAEVSDDSDQTQARIEKLIAELGSPEFRVREAADEQLLAMGLTAYEALKLVVDHQDIEIRLRARRIVAALRGGFLINGVTEELVPLLEDYHGKAADQRLQVMIELQDLLPQQAADALTRLARFEEDEALSRAAARAVLEVPLANRVDIRPMINDIETAIGFSDRPAIQWLRAYCQSFRKESTSAATWKRLLEQATTRELELEETELDRQLDVTLLRQTALDAAEFRGDVAVSREYRRELTAEIDSPVEHEEWLNWLLERSSWQAIIEFSQTHSDGFDKQPVMLYGLAEAQAALGDQVAAEQTAARAMSAISVKEGASTEHFVMAVRLKGARGLYKWAEDEYRVALKSAELGSTDYFRANKWLSELLHDLGRDGEAADLRDEALALMAVTDEIKNDKTEQLKYRQLVLALRQLHDSELEMRARAILFRALHYHARGERDKELAELLKAGEIAGDDVDLLIVMFNFDDPPLELRKMLTAGMNKASATYQREIREFSASFEGEQGPGRTTLRLGLSTSLNQYAWLVGNTEGDIQEAIQNSHKSLRLRMGEAGYLDTLARCYFRAGQLEQALKYQRIAVERAPHELQIQRQLQLFLSESVEGNSGGSG